MDSSTGVLQGSGIQVVGPVYPDESTDESPSEQHVMALVREGESHCDSRDLIHRPVAAVHPSRDTDWWEPMFQYIALGISVSEKCIHV